MRGLGPLGHSQAVRATHLVAGSRIAHAAAALGRCAALIGIISCFFGCAAGSAQVATPGATASAQPLTHAVKPPAIKIGEVITQGAGRFPVVSEDPSIAQGLVGDEYQIRLSTS